MPKQTINVQGSDITIVRQGDKEYICLTDMTQNFGGSELIKAWIRNRQTIEFLGAWESINNPKFNWVEFDPIKNESGSNRKR